jgi:hypothetical protein
MPTAAHGQKLGKALNKTQNQGFNPSHNILAKIIVFEN